MQICETGYAGFDMANAQLIAAAPDMLEVLREVALPPWHDSDLRSLLETLQARAQAAIKKATSE
jgi:hypothetical protein